MIILTSRSDSFAQLLTVLLIFVVVLGATALTTKWIAGYQRELGRSGNIELKDAVRLGNNKYLQIVRVGEKYVAIAVCKDTVTVLCEIPEEQIRKSEEMHGTAKNSFQDVLQMVKQRKKGEPSDDNPEGSKDQEP